jgi:alpha-1,6-mannosyltransferase
VVVLVAAACALAWLEGSPLVPRDAGRPDGGGAPVFLVLLAGAFAAYVAGLWLLRRGAVVPLVAVLVLAAGVQLAPLGAPLLLSTDAWTYWEYGWIANHGHDPYVAAPERFPDNPAFDHAGADWRDTTSVYGPAFTLASQPVAAVAASSADAAAWLFKALAAVAILGTTVLVARLARAPAAAAAFVGWNPLLAVHLAGGGHNDAWVAAAVVGALALAAAGRRGAAGAVWALAVLVKWVPAIFVLLAALASRVRGRRAWAAVLGALSAAAAVALVATLEFGLDWLTAFGPLAANAGTETSYALPNRLEQAGLPDRVAVGLGVAVFTLGLAWLARDARRSGRPRLAPAALLLLVTTPWLAAWYTAWAVPLAALEEDERVRLATLVLCAYLLPQTVPL